jgi:hypothetical protein
MQNKQVDRFIGGWEIDFNDHKSATSFLLTQGVDEEAFNFFCIVQKGLRLTIENNKCFELYERYLTANGEFEEELIQQDSFDLPIRDWEDHAIFFLEKDAEGLHVIGGRKPEEFILPETQDVKSQFHFIGTLDGRDPFFRWLNLSKLHIAFPLYQFGSRIFLDYSDPNKPIILNPDTFDYQLPSDVDPFPDELDFPDPDYSYPIHFLEARYRSTSHINVEKYMETSDLMLCGVPLWYQAPNIPICPKTGERMKFVCTINSDLEIKTTSNDYDFLNFGDYGHLFVFFHPSSKILHLEAQW